MKRQLGHMVRLIDDLLDISRITSGKLQLRNERIELATAVHSAVEATRPLIEAAGHELTVTLPRGADLSRRRRDAAVPDLLELAQQCRQVHGEGGPHLADAPSGNDDRVAISVRDTGIGHRRGASVAHLRDVFAGDARPSSGRRAAWASDWPSCAD